MSGLKIGIVGATGLVGQELVSIIERSSLEVNDLRFFASGHSSGMYLNFRGESISVIELAEDVSFDLNYMFFCVCPRVSERFIPIFSKRGIVCIDNSSRYRLRDDVPLVIPEINSQTLKNHRNIIANPNCSTIIALMALAPLHEIFGLRGLCVSTYQAVSGVGKNGISALMNDLEGDSSLAIDTFGHRIAFNAVPKIGEIYETGYSVEEQKMSDESKKILARNDLRISAICVRVPVMRAHSMSIFASFEKLVDLNKAKSTLEQSENIDFCGEGIFPCALDVSEKDLCKVSRLRTDSFVENGLSMWVVGDQIRKGAALNAFQIMLALEKL
ncbi:MAG: aspartate-semialdehyde dehydrogenase [Puniceicoccales bacterium]|jgi:aspartate-semialdehyde dehydrogenase|nr:aspartate-semialdehyde dehydrogenase [Puniceicoccales bacterium]